MEKEKQLKILYAEDDVRLASLYQGILEREGFEVEVVHDGEMAWQRFQETSPHLVLLDITMPGKSGYDLIEAIREVDTVMPVVVFSSMSDAPSVARALEMGADEFIRKEYSLNEVKARIKAIARRIRGNDVFRLSPQTVFNCSGHALSVGDVHLELTSMETKLLRLLSEKLNGVVTKEYLCEELWAIDTPGKERALDSYLVKLRKYLKADEAIQLKTHYGEGVGLFVVI